VQWAHAIGPRWAAPARRRRNGARSRLLPTAFAPAWARVLLARIFRMWCTRIRWRSTTSRQVPTARAGRCAGPGWDFVTGLGSPNAPLVVDALTGAP
jgi:hypothetical protein